MSESRNAAAAARRSSEQESAKLATLEQRASELTNDLRSLESERAGLVEVCHQLEHDREMAATARAQVEALQEQMLASNCMGNQNSLRKHLSCEHQNSHYDKR